MNRRYRIAFLVFLIVATVGLCVQYAGADLWEQPSNDAVIETPDAVDGEQGLLFGEVLAVDQEHRTILIEISEQPEIQFTVENVPDSVLSDVSSGGSIQVYGTLQTDRNVIVADEIVIDNRHPTDRLYVYATSILGGLLAAGYFLRYWRIEWRQLRFVPRGES